MNRNPFLLSVMVIGFSVAMASCVSAFPDVHDAQEMSDDEAAQGELDRLVGQLTGSYSNETQFAAADDDLKIRPQIGDQRPWIDHQYAVFQKVDIPALKGEVVGLEWRAGGPAGEISRQRFWAFRVEDAQIKMDFYSLKSEIDMSNTEALNGISVTEVISYGPQCALPVEALGDGFAFSIPDTCRITSRSGRDMVLSADITLGETLSYRESGRLVDGTPIFAVPGGMAYEFVRVSD